MAQNTFEMVGKLRMGKEKEKFKPYQERTFDSGWAKRRLVFNAQCGDNRHMLAIDGGTFPNRKGYTIKAYEEGVREGSTYTKGAKIEIPWKDRNSAKYLDRVAGYNLFVIDLNKPNYWEKIKRLNNKVENDEGIADAELAEVGLKEEEEIANAFAEAKEKHHEFLSQWDYAEFMKQMLESEEYSDCLFSVTGLINKSYYAAKQTWYEDLSPKKIYLADEKAEPHSTGTVTLYYDKNAIDDSSVKENGKYYINAYTFEKNPDTNNNDLPCPFQLVIMDAPEDADERAKKLVKRQLARFTVDDDSVKEFRVEFDMLNGAQRVKIDESMLSEDELEDLDAGLITMEELVREYGGSVYGDRVVENRFLKAGYGYAKGVKETAYTSESFVMPTSDDLPWEDSDDEDEDLFDEDDL